MLEQISGVPRNITRKKVCQYIPTHS